MTADLKMSVITLRFQGPHPPPLHRLFVNASIVFVRAEVRPGRMLLHVHFLIAERTGEGGAG